MGDDGRSLDGREPGNEHGERLCARTMRHETDSPNFDILDLGSVSQLNYAATYNDCADAIGKSSFLSLRGGC